MPDQQRRGVGLQNSVEDRHRLMPEPKPIRVLIADDEALARQRLSDLLEKEAGVEVAGTAVNGDEAVREIRRLRPDLVFLDVQMPAKTGLEVVDTVGPEDMPATIFVTAFDQFALKAFDRAALDYLVKPFDFRIHRSAIVRLDRIDTMLRQSGGDYGVRLKNGVELSLSRGRREELEQRLGIAR